MAALYGTDIAACYKPARCGDVRVSIGDPSRAAEQLGFTAKTTLTEGLAATLENRSTAVECKPRAVA